MKNKLSQGCIFANVTSYVNGKGRLATQEECYFGSELNFAFGNKKLKNSIE